MTVTTRISGGFRAAASDTYTVDPDRLAIGRWDEHAQKHVDEGDIYASYSADHIAQSNKVRRPFTFRGKQWVCTSNVGSGIGGVVEVSTAYLLVAAETFEGEAVSYAEKTRDCAAARNDPDGFYHGVRVEHRGDPFVLCGPPARFLPGKPQHGLFDRPTI